MNFSGHTVREMRGSIIAHDSRYLGDRTACTPKLGMMEELSSGRSPAAATAPVP